MKSSLNPEVHASPQFKVWGFSVILAFLMISSWCRHVWAYFTALFLLSVLQVSCLSAVQGPGGWKHMGICNVWWCLCGFLTLPAALHPDTSSICELAVITCWPIRYPQFIVIAIIKIYLKYQAKYRFWIIYSPSIVLQTFFLISYYAYNKKSLGCQLSSSKTTKRMIKEVQTKVFSSHTIECLKDDKTV